MKFHRTAPIALAGLALASFTSAQTPAQTPASNAPASDTAGATSYVRAKDGGAKLKNLPDAKGEMVLAASSGTVMGVHSARAGWLEVEPAGGMKVWVHGSFLKSTGTCGIAEVAANNVRMRPLPASDERSFPLPQKLDLGQRVRVIARANASKALAEDWVQVWSPDGARAWVAAAETTPITADVARSEWAGVAKQAQAATPLVELEGGGPCGGSGSAVAAAPQKKSAAPADAAAAKSESKPSEAPAAAATAGMLVDADQKMAAARAAVNPDFSQAKAAYEAVLAQSPKGSSAEAAHARLDEIAIREEMQKLKVDKETYEKQRVERLSEAEAKLRDAAKKQDPLQGRFQARGWLEREVKKGELTRYVLRWAGDPVAEIVCASGRYDLERYVGSEIGVLGVTARAAVAEAASEVHGEPVRTAKPAVIDATRIEVISAKLRG